MSTSFSRTAPPYNRGSASLTASSRTAPRPTYWSIIAGGTLPGRNPLSRTCCPNFLYAESSEGLSSSNGTSTVSFTRVGPRVSTALFIGRRSSFAVLEVVGAGRLELPISCSQSRRASHYATPRGVAESLGLDGLGGHARAGVAQWQSPSLPSWWCGFDSRRPLQSMTRPGYFVHVEAQCFPRSVEHHTSNDGFERSGDASMYRRPSGPMTGPTRISRPPAGSAAPPGWAHPRAANPCWKWRPSPLTKMRSPGIGGRFLAWQAFVTHSKPT